jgi:predicted N-acetyltransferase YhbS
MEFTDFQQFSEALSHGGCTDFTLKVLYTENSAVVTTISTSSSESNEFG